MKLSLLDLTSVAAFVATAPFLVLGFRNYIRRLRAATWPAERLAARNGILLGVGIAIVAILPLLTVIRHLAS